MSTVTLVVHNQRANAFELARDDPGIGVVILTGEGTEAFSSGGDQRIRGDDGYIGDDEVAEQGVGRLDVGAALDGLQGPAPAPDRFEPNDDAGAEAATVYHGMSATATLDWWDDPNDVYRIHLAKGQRLSVVVHAGPKNVDPTLVLWKPGLDALADARSDLRARRSIHGPGVPERIRFKAPRSAWYYLQVKLARPGFGPYRIHLAF